MSYSTPTMVPFRIVAYYEATSAQLSTDSTVDNKPTLNIGATQGNRGAFYSRNGTITTVAIRVNPTNAVTADFEIYQSPDGANNSYQLRADNLFKSWDNAVNDVADLADDTEYKWEGLEIPFTLDNGSPGDFWFNLDWSGAPGDTTGYIMIGGWREA